MRQKTYRTERLVLRNLRLTDWQAWCATQANISPPKNKWDIEPTSLRKRTRPNYVRTLTAQRKRFKKSGTLLWSMFLKESGEFVGWIDISIIARERYQMANFGWFVFNTYRGQGFAKESVKKIIGAAFADLNLHRLEAAIDPRNKVSLRMARSCGLHREGVKKKYLQDKEGDWKDMVIFIATPELFYEKPKARH